MAGETILVVDDEPNIRSVLRAYLVREGFTVVEAADGLEAIEKAKKYCPVFILLDLMLPKLDGWEVCREVRKHSRVPIIMLTARGDEVDRVAGLELGADDYVSKPFSPRELMARVKAVLRRIQPNSEETATYRVGEIMVNRDTHQAWCNESELTLTPKEFDMLCFLAAAQGRVCSREILLERVWGYEYAGDVRTVDSHVKTLREKIGPIASGYIRTVWGVGYRMDATVPGAQKQRCTPG